MNPGIGLLAVAAGLVGMAAIDRGLSALWPGTYGLYHPLAAIAAANLPLLAVYLVMRS